MMTASKTTAIVLGVAALVYAGGKGIQPKADEPQFLTSDRCQACHNGLVTASGRDVSIGAHWRATMMANSSHDPYWMAGVRRESIDHPESQADIEDECSVCHMPITRYEAHLRGKKGEIFSHLPIRTDEPEMQQAADGVSCSVCHQITPERFGKPESYNGGFVARKPEPDGTRIEYGPFAIDRGRMRIMRSSTEGYRPEQGTHIRESELCASCHTLATTALGPGGKNIGSLPEQMPYPEWLHSGYRNTQSCQSCHMPAIAEPAPISRVLGEPREGARLHSFVGGNFFMLSLLNRYRDELSVTALPSELAQGVEYTLENLKTRAATVAIENVSTTAEPGRLRAEVVIHNKNGHKLPTAYPSRRAWIHFVVRDAQGRAVFESGALQADGAIAGNDGDADAARYEPHYSEIREAGQVQIYETVMGDVNGLPTTGLLTGVRYLKDNRLLPEGFDKQTASRDVAVVGDALTDPAFSGGGHRVRYSVALGGASGPYTVEAELLYQPIAYRWAHNLERYSNAMEPKRFLRFYNSMQSSTGTAMATASVRVDR